MTAKLPNAETCCDHRRADGVNPCPDCRLEVDAAGQPIDRVIIAHRDLVSAKCPVCGKPKKEQQSFCKRDYARLHPALRAGLYKTFAEGYTTEYFRALEYLAADAALKARRA